MSRFNKIIGFAILLLACLVLFRFVDPKTVQIIRAVTFDLYQRVLPKNVERLPITIVDIDEKSLAEIGQWPWPRSTLIELLQQLSILQPQVIGFDMVFPEPDRFSAVNLLDLLAKQNPPIILSQHQLVNSDAEFAAVIAGKQIVLGTMLNSSLNNSDEQKGPKTTFKWNSDPTNYIPLLSSRIANLPELEAAANSIGVLTLVPEVDGIVRRIPSVYRVNNQVWPSFGLELLRTALMEQTVEIEVDQAGIDAITVGGIDLPTTEQGLTWLHFNPHQKSRFVSAIDVLNGELDIDSFLGHIFLIGTSAGGLHDIKMTPMGQQMPGVEIWAQWLESALFGNLLERPNYATVAETVFLIISGLLLIFLTNKASARVSAGFYLLLTILCIGFSWWMYTDKLQLFDASFAILSIGILFACLMLMKYWHEEQSRKQIKNAFSHYLSPSIVDKLASDPNQLKLGGELREITSLFTDLQGFTKMSEMVEPEKLVELINRYLDGICKVIITHGGTIDKIIGDAVHAMFGAPNKDSSHAEKAVSCALQIDRFCQQFRAENSHEFKFGETRIGVNSGAAVVGNFGGEQRFDYTAYGDTINTAARLESANQYLGTTICIADSTKNLCVDRVFRPVADITVKGRSESLMVYEPLAHSSAEHDYLEEYCEIFFGLQNQSVTANDELKKLAKEFPNDKVIKNLLDNIRQSNVISVKRILSEK